MGWKSPFVIYRINSKSQLEEVYQAADLKQAKYWLQYIAQAGDVLCKTPLHPKHSKNSERAEYWSHKDQVGGSQISEEEWREYAARLDFAGEFPSTQAEPEKRS